MLSSLWHKYISRLCSVHVISLLYCFGNVRHWRTHFSSFFAILPLFCSRVLSRCSSSSSALPTHTQDTQDQRSQTGTEENATCTSTTYDLYSVWTLQSHFGSWNIHKPSLPDSIPPNKKHLNMLGGKENAGDCKLWPLNPPWTRTWRTNPGSSNPTMPCSRTTYSFSWASRSRTSASRLLTSMTSSSSSSCSRRFCASVFCQSRRWNGNNGDC